jgi:2-dehydropantoate 2-reductase
MQVQQIPEAPRLGGSTWQSLARESGSAEVDYLNGEIALLGRLHGVPTPLNDLLQRLVTEYARDRRKPGELTPSRLRALLG